jgi:transcriptional regulator with XRE-family HTH domain
MDREEFGELIASLREELGWTQAQLAERVDADNATISNMERGAKKHFDPDLLHSLANAFGLTRAERQQFFLAASGLDEKKMMRPVDGYSPERSYDAAEQLEGLIHLVGRMRIPCFLVDVYQEIIAANAIIMELLKFPVDKVEELRKIPGGLTAVWLVHGEGGPVQATASEQWETFAINNLRVFRESSLRYRARPYFKYLMQAFRDPAKYPTFDRYWRLLSTLEEDEEAGANQYAYTHPDHGRLAYHVFSSLNTTPYGELYVYQLMPTDEHTTDTFEDLARRPGTRAYRMAPWPEKIMI